MFRYFCSVFFTPSSFSASIYLMIIKNNPCFLITSSKHTVLVLQGWLQLLHPVSCLFCTCLNSWLLIFCLVTLLRVIFFFWLCFIFGSFYFVKFNFRSFPCSFSVFVFQVTTSSILVFIGPLFMTGILTVPLFFLWQSDVCHALLVH